MALTREQKAARIAAAKERMIRASSLVFAHYAGLNVAHVSALRRKLKEQQAEMTVVKKTLLARAAEEAGWPVPAESDLPGAVACIFSFGDPLAGAQVTFAFGREHASVKIIGGVFEGTTLNREQALAFATVPSRSILLSMFAQILRSPLVSFASACNAPLTNFARSLTELAKEKQSSPPSP